MKLTLNLATRPYVNRRALKGLYAVAITILLLSLAGNALYFWRLQQQSGQVKTHLAEVEKGLSELRGEPTEEVSASMQKELAAEIAEANDILNREAFRWTLLLGRLEEVTIEGVTIVALQPEYKEKALKIRALGQNVDRMRAFLDLLLTSSYFSEVLLFDQAVTEVSDNMGLKRDALSFSLVVKGAF